MAKAAFLCPYLHDFFYSKMIFSLNYFFFPFHFPLEKQQPLICNYGDLLQILGNTLFLNLLKPEEAFTFEYDTN